MVAGRAPGSATFRSAPQSVRRVAPPDKVAPYRKWRALVRRHARARPAALRLRGAQLFLKARALYVTVLRTPASGDPGPRLRRGPAGRPAAHERGRHAARSVDSIPGAPHADPTPRQAGPAVGHGRALSRSEAGARRRGRHERRHQLADAAKRVPPDSRRGVAGGPRRSHRPTAQARGPGGDNTVIARAAHSKSDARLQQAGERARDPLLVRGDVAGRVTARPQATARRHRARRARGPKRATSDNGPVIGRSDLSAGQGSGAKSRDTRHAECHPRHPLTEADLHSA